jgi:hypothetical protein
MRLGVRKECESSMGRDGREEKEMDPGFTEDLAPESLSLSAYALNHIFSHSRTKVQN